MITTDRQAYTGFNSTKKMKEALREAAKKEKQSMSEFIDQMLTQALRERGYDI